MWRARRTDGGQVALGRSFSRLWGAFAISTSGTWLAFDAFPLIAVLVLHAGPTKVAVLAAAGMAVGAVLAVPLGPWMEFRRKRPVMITMDLIRCAALLTVPAAYALGELGFAQLLIVAVVVGAADITFTAASGAYLKWLVPREDLLIANGRFESTQWSATMLGPPLGGAAIGILGPVVTVIANAFSFVGSALGLRAIGPGEPQPPRPVDATSDTPERLHAADLLEGWRYLFGQPTLRALFLNNALVGGLILATTPLLAVMMLGQLHFRPWQYGLSFGAPCIGGLIGSRLARRLVARHGRHRVMRVAGTLRACFPVGLVFLGHGWAGMGLVIAIELALITCMGVFNPVLATYRLEQIEQHRLARTLSAWSVTNSAVKAGMIALWGVLAAATSPRFGVGLAGVLLLATPLLLTRIRPAAHAVAAPVRAASAEAEPARAA